MPEPLAGRFRDIRDRTATARIEAAQAKDRLARRLATTPEVDAFKTGESCRAMPA